MTIADGFLEMMEGIEGDSGLNIYIVIGFLIFTLFEKLAGVMFNG